MEASFCLRELVEKRFHSFQSQRNSSPILTPLERFLSSSSNITKPPCQASDGGHVSAGFSADGALSLFNTIGALPSGILLNNSSTYEGIVCFGGKSMAALTEDNHKMHANISFSSSSSRSSSNSTTTPPLNNIIKGQWTAEEDRFHYIYMIKVI